MSEPLDKREEIELPAATEFRQRPKEEVDAATERICIGGKDSAIDFFSRHPDLGLAIAVDLQCELTERKDQLRASLAANREKDAELSLLRSEAAENARIIGMSGSREAAKDAEIERLRGYLIQAGREAGALLADDVSTEFLRHVPDEIKLKLASLRASAGEKPEDAFNRGQHVMLTRINGLLYEDGEGLNLASMKYVAPGRH
jgi:hypothetical protein